jgi:hypothetical protein
MSPWSWYPKFNWYKRGSKTLGSNGVKDGIVFVNVNVLESWFIRVRLKLTRAQSLLI